MIDTANLPDNIDALKAMIVEQSTIIIGHKAQAIARDELISRLEMLVKAFKQTIFGRKSEKLDPDQFELALEDIETAVEVAESEQDANPAMPESAGLVAPKTRTANRGHLPKHLPRVEQIIEPEHKACACGHDLHVIGEDVSERLDVIPAQFQVIVTRRPKYGCRACEDGITQAPAPEHVVRAGLPTEGLIAHVLVAKYADHLPLYRQAQIYSRQGIELDRSTLAGWVGKAALHLKPGIFGRWPGMTGHGMANPRPVLPILTPPVAVANMRKISSTALTAFCRWMAMAVTTG
jgi:transposase